MNPELTFTWATQDDLSNIETFFRRNFGQDSIQGNPDRCKWLYFDNPQGIHVSLCRHGDEIVGACGHLPQNVQIGSQTISAGFGIDFMVAPDWRRKGIGRKFLEMRLDRFLLSLSMGQSRGMAALYRNCGGLNLGPIKMGIFRKHPSLFGKFKNIARNNVAWALGLGGMKIPKAIDFEIIGDLRHSAICSENQWGIWRFEDGPYGDYEFKAIGLEKKNLGIAVCRKNNGLNQIVDIFGKEPNRPLLLAVGARLSLEKESRILFAGDRLAVDCRRAGFLVRPYGSNLMALTKYPDLRAQLKPGSLDITSGSGDTDILRNPVRLRKA